MLLADTLDAVAADVTARMSEVKFYLGLKNVSKNSVPPRVVWGPEVDQFDGAYNSAKIARCVRQRLAAVRIHCWGRTLLEAEQLQQLLIAALHRTVGGPAYSLDTATWEKPKWADRGECTTFTVRIRIPIVDDSFGLLLPPIGHALEPGASEQIGDGILESNEPNA